MKDAFDFLRQKYQTKMALFVKWIEQHSYTTSVSIVKSSAIAENPI